MKINSIIILLLLSISAFSDTLQYRFDLPYFKIETVTYNDITYSRIITEKKSYTIKDSVPEIPRYTKSLLVNKHTILNNKIATFSSTTIILDNPLLPSITQSKNPAEAHRISGEIYNKDAFFPKQIVTKSHSYLLNEAQGYVYEIFPFQYNPQTRELIIYHSIDIEFSSNNSLEFPSRKINNFIDKALFINRQTTLLKSATIEKKTENHLLIISDPAFIETLTPFVTWKRQKGFITNVVSSDQFATNEALKTFIKTEYLKNKTRYVLLVGDAEQIPPIEFPHGDSDLAYGYIEGDDSYPELVVGRFSGNTNEQIAVQVEKSIAYEHMKSEASGNYDEYLLVASNEGNVTNDSPPGYEYDYEHLVNIKQKLVNATYSTGIELYDGSQGGGDAPGNPDNTDLTNAINSNVGCFIYTGHGETSSLTTSGFTNADIPNLTNSSLPFGLFAGCLVGNFRGGNSLAEAFLQAKTGTCNGLSIAFGSTALQYWNPPKYAQNVFTDLLTNLDSETSEATAGALFYNSMLAMNDEYDIMGFETTDTWVLFGDPTLQPVTDSITRMSITINNTPTLGDTTLSITSDTKNALACLSQHDSILSIANITIGENILAFPYISKPDDVLLTVTAFNKEVSQQSIPVDIGSEPFISLDSSIFKNTQHQRSLNYRDTILFSAYLSNFTNVDISNASLKITCSDSDITFLQDEYSLASLIAGQQIFAEHIFTFKVNNSISVGKHIQLTITIQHADKSWIYNKEVYIQVPQLEISNILFSPTAYSNSNNLLEPGEILYSKLIITNVSPLETSISDIHISGTDYVSLQSDTYKKTIQPYSNDTIEYLMAIPQYYKQESGFALHIQIAYDNFLLDTTVTFSLGTTVEDWETGNTEKFDWQLFPPAWNITSESYEGNYALKSSAIPDSGSALFQLSISVLQTDSVSFFYKVSSEKDYDWLAFYIDDTEISRYSGEINWTFFSHPITKGVHTITWRYFKDASVTEGSDYAWIDNIYLPPIEYDLSNRLRFINRADTTAEISQYYETTLYTNMTHAEFSSIILPSWLQTESNEFGIRIYGTPTHTTIDTVFISAKLGNEDCYSLFTIHKTNISTSPAIDANTIILSPNPASGYCHIHSTSSKIIQLEILSISGISFASIQIDANDYVLDLSSLQNGTYYIKVKTSDTIIYKSLIIYN